MMKSTLSLCAAILAGLCLTATAQAQFSGKLPPGTVLGNSGNAAAAAVPLASRLSARLNPTPGSTYVAVGGLDTADCMAATVTGVHGPCATIQRALTAGLSRDARENVLRIKAGPGTFSAPVAVNGPNVGSASSVNFTNATSMPLVLIEGADGSGSTTIFGPATYLGQNYCYAILANGGAIVALKNLAVQADGGGGSCNVSDLYVQAAQMWVIGGVVLKSASGNLISMEANALFYNTPGTVTPGLTLAGNGYNAINIDGSSTFVSDSTVQISGPLTFAGSCFLNISYHSTFKITIPNPAFTSGQTVSGRRFCLDGLSDLVIGNPPAAWPGDSLGIVSNSSRYQAPDGPIPSGAGPCMGGSVGCPNAVGPTGLGVGSAAMASGGGAYGGAVQLTAGAGAAASGGFFIWLPYELNRGACSTFFTQGTGTWSPRAGTAVTGFTTSDGLAIAWDNNAVALTDGLTYYLGYSCNTTQ